MAVSSSAALPYREVLLPRVWVWLMPLAFAACLGIAYGYAYGPVQGWLVAAITAGLLLGALLLGARTPIEVDATGVRAGRARLPTQFVGRVAALDADQTFRARTSAADPRAHLVLRPWASSRAVVMEVSDPDDPHPYWLISTRRPERLAEAIAAARSQAPSG